MAQNLSGNDLQGWDGWIWIGGGSRVSATSLTITGDYTAIISPGDRLKLTDTTTKYFYVLTPVTFSAGVTTLTITGGSDYSLVGTPSAISYSKMASPASFPQWFNWTATYAGFSTSPTTSVTRFNISGRQVTLSIHSASGTSNATTFTISLPVTAATITGQLWVNRFYTVDNGTAAATVDYGNIGSAATVLTMAHNDNNGGWTASGTKFCNGQIVYEF